MHLQKRIESAKNKLYGQPDEVKGENSKSILKMYNNQDMSGGDDTVNMKSQTHIQSVNNPDQLNFGSTMPLSDNNEKMSAQLASLTQHSTISKQKRATAVMEMKEKDKKMLRNLGFDYRFRYPNVKINDNYHIIQVPDSKVSDHMLINSEINTIDPDVRFSRNGIRFSTLDRTDKPFNKVADKMSDNVLSAMYLSQRERMVSARKHPLLSATQRTTMSTRRKKLNNFTSIPI